MSNIYTSYCKEKVNRLQAKYQTNIPLIVSSPKDDITN